MSLMTLLPSYYQGNVTMEELQAILSTKINTLADNLNEMIDQSFVSTATELLSRYEQIYGLEVDVSKSNEFRRERIIAKIKGVGTVTKQMLVEVARSYSNGEVEVVEDNANYSFTIRFVGSRGIPANMTDLTMTIQEIKPAHLSFTFEYIYNTHAELKIFTHAHLMSYTNDQLRNEVLS